MVRRAPSREPLYAGHRRVCAECVPVR